MDSSNTTCGMPELLDATFRYYDAMPYSVREFLRNAIYDYATTSLARDLRQGATVQMMIDALMYQDVENGRKDAALAWPKQAAEYLAAQRPRRRRDWLDKPVNSRL